MDMVLVQVYTFYNKEDPIRPNVCIIRNDTSLQSPVRACEHCVTGPARYLAVKSSLCVIFTPKVHV